MVCLPLIRARSHVLTLLFLVAVISCERPPAVSRRLIGRICSESGSIAFTCPDDAHKSNGGYWIILGIPHSEAEMSYNINLQIGRDGPETSRHESTRLSFDAKEVVRTTWLNTEGLTGLTCGPSGRISLTPGNTYRIDYSARGMFPGPDITLWLVYTK